jgi:L-ribulose-5-phosphate 4-epimerase
MNVRSNPESLIGGRLSAELAAVTRMLEMKALLSYSGHVSVRVPGQDALMIQRHVDSRAEVLPERMLIVDFDGKVIEGKGKPPSETAIHTEILKARPDVNAVLHCHMELAIAFTMMKGVKLLPLRSRAMRWVSGIPIHPDPSHIKFVEQGRALAQTLGPHNAVLMRAHGITMVAESLQGILVDAVHFEENAQAQMQVMQAGAEPIPLSAEDMELINRNENRPHHCNKLWIYYVRKAMAAGVVPQGWNLLDSDA